MSEKFQKLVTLMATLRAADGCPWDRKQTHESLKPYLLEETYEVLEVLDQKDRTKLPEELGDVLLQVLFHSQIASESGSFTIENVLDQLADKLIRRHPHIFKTEAISSIPMKADQVVAQWEEIKRTERHASGRPESALDGVPQMLPALLRAFQIQTRASRVGFDWAHDVTGFDQILGKIEEEVQELRLAAQSSAFTTVTPDHEVATLQQEEIISEFGDVLFSLVNLARFMKIDPENALRQTTNCFIERFQFIEAHAMATGRTIQKLSLAEMNQLWNEAKARTSSP